MRFQIVAGLLVSLTSLTNSFAQQPVNLQSKDPNAVIAEKLGIAAWSIQTPQVIRQVDHTLSVPDLLLNGQLVSAELELYSQRSPNFTVYVTDDHGNLVPASNVPPLTTYRGEIKNSAGNKIGTIRASLNEDNELDAMVFMDTANGREIFGIQPLSTIDDQKQAVFAKGEHAVFAAQDILAFAGICGLEANAPLTPLDKNSPKNILPPSGDPPVNVDVPLYRKTEIGIDADSAFYAAKGSNLNTVVSDVENVMNKVEGIYELDVQIEYEITAIVVREGPDKDPYDQAGKDPGTLLNKFSGIWQNSTRKEIDIPRDVAHYFTGINLSGSTIGIASLSSICNKNNHYGLSQSTFSSNLTNRAGLTAHEIGHNWSAGHCDADGDCKIMCSALGACGPVTSFGHSAMASISGHRDTRNCLSDEYDRLDPPFFSNFEYTDINSQNVVNPRLWNYARDQQIDSIAANEVSGNFSLHLNTAATNSTVFDDVRTTEIKMQTIAGEQATRGVFLTFFAQCKGMEPGEFINIRYFNDQRLWTDLFSLTQPGIDETAFTFHKIPIPADAFWQQFRIQISTEGGIDETNDECFIEDLSVSAGGLALSQPNALKGSTVDIQVYGANPNEEVQLYFSTTGIGDGVCTDNGKLCFDLLGPCFLLGIAPADANGVATFTLNVLPNMSNPIYTQALIPRVDPSMWVVSNAATFTPQ